MRHIALAAAFATLATSSAFAEPAGYTPLVIDAPHHGRDILGALMHPSKGDGRAFTFGENAVFHGVTVVEEATVKDGKHPVVLLSHGIGGNIRSLAWLATGLAERGAIVVSLNHPNSTWGDFNLSGAIQHWTRAQDLSAALDTLLADPRFNGHLDTKRIMAAGFSYGGWTALSMAGVRGRYDGYVRHCEQYGEDSSNCEPIMGDEKLLETIDPARWNGDYADARITHAAAVDPALIWELKPEDIAGLIDNVSIIGLGDSQTRLLATDFDASGFAELLPSAQYDRIVPAFHFTALALCKPMGEAILIEENDDPVCTDPAGTDRKAVHDAVIERMASDLGL